jgi:hypothetical protein
LRRRVRELSQNELLLEQVSEISYAEAQIQFPQNMGRKEIEKG